MNRSRSPIASRLAASLFASCSICAAVASYDGAKEVMAAILREVVAVAKAQGMALDYDERWEAIVSLLRRAVGAKPSMLQDVEASRRTEIEVINGAIVRAGKSAGIPTPVNETMVAMIGALQAKYLAVRA